LNDQTLILEDKYRIQVESEKSILFGVQISCTAVEFL